jgi:hypothetical protein
MFKALADMFETTVVSVSEAEAIDESVETPELLAREAARKVFEESGDEAEYVVEMETGFAVIGDGGQSIFMGHDGGFQVVDTPSDEEPEDDDTANEDDEPSGTANEDDEPLTLEGLTANVEAVVDDIEDYGEAVEALRKFDEAKDAQDMDAALAAVDLLEQKTGATVSRSQPIPTPGMPPAPKAPTDVQGSWKPGGNPYVPTPKTPAPPKKPVSVGPGPGKSTGKDGSTGGKVGVPASAPPAPKPPKSAGNTKESVDEAKGDERKHSKLDAELAKLYDKMNTASGTEAAQLQRKISKVKSQISALRKKMGLSVPAGWGESVDVRVPRARVEEFLKLAAEAGAPDDANVETEGDEFIITLPEDVAEAVSTLMG